MKITVKEGKYLTGYAITMKTVFTLQIDLCIIIFYKGLFEVNPVYDRKPRITCPFYVLQKIHSRNVEK